ncbi:hypothetical protein N7481_013130 [Penicillium waksmanii]|uniref:uncharacterized protein n=1 Tax=Penicillium waksmanii TaxID=69791 RepID=UPI002549808D|nr:uncharacterized protein N7481_013130 [Penicillium waksmanii]KAJ5966416.1 hypothetical protein N7481_013130 [Penicillium waksmanii]
MPSKVPKRAPALSKSDSAPLQDSQQTGRDTIYKLIASMHLQCEYSDLTIICKGRKCDRQFEAHKIVLCQRSEYLASLCEDLEKSQDPSKPLFSTREPILFEKVLEFLYKSDYTVPSKPSIEPATPSGGRTFRKAQLAKIDADKTTAAQSTEPAFEETEEKESLEEFEQLGNELVDVSPEEEMEKEVEGNILHDDDTFLEECHPCYFHARMYIEAGWWKVHDLKVKAKAHFMKAFMDDPDPKSFSKTIEAIYAINTNYTELKDEVIKFMVQNMTFFWKGAGVTADLPLLTPKLMKDVPEFTLELFPKFLDICFDRGLLSQIADNKPKVAGKKKGSH